MNNYAINTVLALKPLYISLGIPRESFTGGASTSSAPFDAAMDGGPRNPDCTWFFRGEECFLYDQKAAKFTKTSVPIPKVFDVGGWPATFSSGVDAATWAGPSFPDFYYLFKESELIRVNLKTKTVDIGPRYIKWYFGGSETTWFNNGCDVAIHLLGLQNAGILQFFHANEYERHTLFDQDGSRVAGPAPFSDLYSLPSPFSEGIDLAFYGSGVESEKIYFFSGSQYCRVDTHHGVEETGLIETKFPAMSEYLIRPQLFLVEDYSLTIYTGKVQRGAYVSSVTVAANSSQVVKVVTEVTETTAEQRTRSVLSSQDSATMNSFYDEMKQQNQQGGSTEQNHYNFDGSFHGEASASGLGGSVDANASARGGSDSVRNSFAEAAFGTIANQVSESSHNLQQQVYQSGEAYNRSDHTVSTVEVSLSNPDSRDRVTNFYRQIQPYLTLLTLDRVRVAYSDGADPADIAGISGVNSLLARYIGKPEPRAVILDTIVHELSNIDAADGTAVSIFKPTSPPASGAAPAIPTVNPSLTGQYTTPDGEVITTTGIIKAAKLFYAPTDGAAPFDSD